MSLLFLNQWIPEAFLRALCWTLIHSLWIGTVAAVVAGILIGCTPKSSALLRYNLLVLLFTFFVLATGFLFFPGAVPIPYSTGNSYKHHGTAGKFPSLFRAAEPVPHARNFLISASKFVF